MSGARKERKGKGRPASDDELSLQSVKGGVRYKRTEPADGTSKKYENIVGDEDSSTTEQQPLKKKSTVTPTTVHSEIAMSTTDDSEGVRQPLKKKHHSGGVVGAEKAANSKAQRRGNKSNKKPKQLQKETQQQQQQQQVVEPRLKKRAHPSGTADLDAPLLTIAGIDQDTDVDALRTRFARVGGPVVSVQLAPGTPRQALVQYRKKHSAEIALISSALSDLHVSFAAGEQKRVRTFRLFVGRLGLECTSEHLASVFSVYGEVEEAVVVERGQPAKSRGFGFVKYVDGASYQCAIDALNGVYVMKGETSPIVVKVADPPIRVNQQQQQQRNPPAKQHRTAAGDPPPSNTTSRRRRKGDTHGSELPAASLYSQIVVPNSSSEEQCANRQPKKRGLQAASEPFEPKRPLQVPPYHGGFQWPAAQYQHYYYEQQQPVTPFGYYPPPRAEYSSGGYPAAPLIGQFSPSFVAAAPLPIRQQPDVGPEGANLFLFHLPLSWTDAELIHHFSPFGTLLSATVFVDKATGISKCFGFVSYDSPESAQAAIKVMDHFSVLGKKLRVELKKKKDKDKKRN